MNHTVLVGRLTKDPEIQEISEGKKVTNITLAVTRNYKNEEGIYETDFIDVVLWNGIANNAAEFCKVGDVVGIKGRLQSFVSEKDDKKIYKVNVVAEKVTFLSSKSKDIHPQDNER